MKQTDKDKEIDIQENEEVERTLNGHLIWWSRMTNMGEYWKQEDRNRRNFLNHGLLCA